LPSDHHDASSAILIHGGVRGVEELEGERGAESLDGAGRRDAEELEALLQSAEVRLCDERLKRAAGAVRHQRERMHVSGPGGSLVFPVTDGGARRRPTCGAISQDRHVVGDEIIGERTAGEVVGPSCPGADRATGVVSEEPAEEKCFVRAGDRREAHATRSPGSVSNGRGTQDREEGDIEGSPGHVVLRFQGMC